MGRRGRRAKKTTRINYMEQSCLCETEETINTRGWTVEVSYFPFFLSLTVITVTVTVSAMKSTRKKLKMNHDVEKKGHCSHLNLFTNWKVWMRSDLTLSTFDTMKKFCLYSQCSHLNL